MLGIQASADVAGGGARSGAFTGKEKVRRGQVAHYIFALAEVLKAGLAFIADRIITAMVFQAAALAASATGDGLLGGAASAALAAAQATLAVMKWAELTAQFTKTAMALTLALGASSAIMGTTVDAVQGFPEVGGGYDHKAV